MELRARGSGSGRRDPRPATAAGTTPVTEPDPPAAPLAPTGGRPAEAFTERTGVVATFDDLVGAGTLVDDATGAPWWFHCTRIADGTRTIAIGVPVTFCVEPGPTGLEAVAVAPTR